MLLGIGWLVWEYRNFLQPGVLYDSIGIKQHLHISPGKVWHCQTLRIPTDMPLLHIFRSRSRWVHPCARRQMRLTNPRRRRKSSRRSDNSSTTMTSKLVYVFFLFFLLALFWFWWLLPNIAKCRLRENGKCPPKKKGSWWGSQLVSVVSVLSFIYGCAWKWGTPPNGHLKGTILINIDKPNIDHWI